MNMHMHTLGCACASTNLQQSLREAACFAVQRCELLIVQDPHTHTHTHTVLGKHNKPTACKSRGCHAFQQHRVRRRASLMQQQRAHSRGSVRGCCASRGHAQCTTHTPLPCTSASVSSPAKCGRAVAASVFAASTPTRPLSPGLRVITRRVSRASPATGWRAPPARRPPPC
jgi:hypothetical protein